MIHQWFLKGEMGDHSPWTIPVNKLDFLLGRGEDCDLVVNDNSVSRRHCRVFFRREEPWIVDLESRNGSFLNGIRLEEERPIKNGDIIKIGRVEFLFSQSQESPSSEQTLYDDGRGNQQSFSERYNFSERETEVFYLLLKGGSVKDIAEKLFISPGTAKNHVLKIYKKTETHSRIELSTLFYQFQKTV